MRTTAHGHHRPARDPDEIARMGPVGRRRVSYVIPPPTEPVARLQLPPIHTPASPPRSSAPLLRPSPVQPALPQTQRAPAPATQHPRHRLGVACLALDASTHLVGRHAPEGILYTGGRDGLVIAWDLAVPMRPRSRPPQAFSSYSPRVAGRFAHRRWDLLTGWGDDVIDEDVEEEDEIRSDGDILGDVKGSGKRRRPSVSDAQGAADARAAAELNWEIDPARWQDGKVRTRVPCARVHVIPPEGGADQRPRACSRRSSASLPRRTRTGSTISFCVTTTRPVRAPLRLSLTRSLTPRPTR